MNAENYADLLNQGTGAMSVGNYEKAAQYFKQAVELDKHNKEGYSHLGNAYASMEKYDEALAVFEKIKLLDGDDAANYFSIGNVYILKDNLVKAVESYNKAEEKGFERVELYANLAGIYRELGEQQQAIRSLTKGIRVAPFRGDLRVEKAMLYIEMGKFNEALETLEELQKISPDAFEAYDLQTQIYCGLQQHDKALEIISQATEKFEKDVVLQWIKVKVLVEMKRFEEANKEIEILKQASDYDTVAREVAIQESIIHSSNNNVPSAISALESALEYENGNIDEQSRYLLMNLYVTGKDYEKALTTAEVLESTKSVSLFCVSAMYYKPYIWKLQGRTEEARSRFKDLVKEFRTLSINNPTSYELYMYRLLSHVEIEEYEKALELADYIETLSPDRSDAYALKYTIYSAMGNEDEANKNKEKAKSLNPYLSL